MNDFKWKHFRGEMILGCVRWYCKYGISYRDLEEMMMERGVEVDHSFCICSSMSRKISQVLSFISQCFYVFRQAFV